MARESLDIPHSMRKVHRRFERWRSAHTARLPIPERLWAAAVGLAREHGVSPTAQAASHVLGKNCPNKRPNRSIKEVLGYPLTPRFRELLAER